MTIILPNNERLIHFVVDPQEHPLDKLSPNAELKALFPRGLRAFSNELRAFNIPTILAAYGSAFKFHHDPQTRQPDLKRLGVENFGLKDDELLFEKSHENAFYIPLLEEYLKRLQISGIILDGKHVRACVSKTIDGVLNAGLQCYAIPDLMADGNVDPQLEFDAKQHQHFLYDDKFIGTKLFFFTPEGFLKALKEKPAPPIKATPVSGTNSLTLTRLTLA